MSQPNTAKLLSFVALSAAFLQARVPSSTGQDLIPPGVDRQYIVVSDTTKDGGGYKDPKTGIGYAYPLYIRANQPPEWTVQDGVVWIAPNPDQAGPAGGCAGDLLFAGTTVYELHFDVGSDELAATNLYASILVDDSVVVTVNGKAVSVTPTPGWVTPGTLHLTAQNLQAGTNVVQFAVKNECGNTGLSVLWTGNIGVPQAVTTTSTGKHSYGLMSLEEPVDSASGAYLDAAIDLKLGGPMGLSFMRYYSSDLWTSGLQSALGVNWMHNFDSVLKVSGTSANVLLFGGRAVTFQKSGGAWQLQAPTDVAYQLAQNGANYQLLDPTDRRIYTYSAAGLLTKIEDRNGNAITVTQGPFGPATVSDGLGRTLTFTYSNGQLTNVQDQTKRSMTYLYSGRDLAGFLDDAGRTTRYTNTTVTGQEALILSTKMPRGNTTVSQTYDPTGRVNSQTDGNGNKRTVTYDSNGGVTITDSLSSTVRQTSDSNGDATAQTDAAGVRQVIALDSSNRRTSVSDGAGNTSTYTYDSQSGYIQTVTDPRGNTTTYSYSGQQQNGLTFYNLIGVTFADGTKTVYTYDAAGNVQSLTGRDGSSTTFTYDSNGRMLTATATDGSVGKFTWNADGTLASSTDYAGNKTAYEYDSLSRLNKITDSNGGVTAITRATDKNKTFSYKSPAQSAVTLAYDLNGQLQTLTTPTGGAFQVTRTPTSRIASIADALKNTTNYTYDARDRLLKTTDGSGVVTTNGYDAGNRLVSTSAASGVMIAYTYTSNNKIASIADALGNKTSFTYGADGRFSSITSPSGAKSLVTYDKLGLLASATDALGGTLTQTRDSASRLTQLSIRGASTTLGYNSRGFVTSLTSANGNKWTLDYDAGGRVTKFTDPLGNATTSTYTGSFLSQVTLPLGTIAITSDADGRVTKRSYSDGTVVNTGFDAAGLLISADKVAFTRDLNGRIVNSNGLTLAYDKAGRVASVTYASGKTVNYTYDSSGRLVSLTDWVGGKTTLDYDAGSRVTGITYPNAVVNNYTYDAESRVTSVKLGKFGSIALTRDAVGKITAADRNIPQVPAVSSTTTQFNSYDAAGELKEATYDKMGRVTSQNGRTYTWNLATQLVSFKDGVNTASFTYDGLGLLNSVTAGSDARTFALNYAFAYPALSVVRQGAKDLRYYVYLPNGNLLYSIDADNSRRFYHFDEMGNTVLLTNDQGTTTDGYAITPYGEIAAHTGATDNPFTWQGQFGVYQEGDGLYNMRTRHYDASTARFLSRDDYQSPEPASSEPYSYAKANPLLYIDPLGRSGDPIAGVIAGIRDGVIGFFNTAGQFLSSTAAAAAGWIESVVSVHFPPCTTCVDYPPVATYLGGPAEPYTPPASKVVTDAPALPVAVSLKESYNNDADPLVNTNGSNLVNTNGSNVVATDSAGVAPPKAVGLIGQDGMGYLPAAAGLIGNDGSTALPPLAGIVGQGGGNSPTGIVAQGGLNAVPPAATAVAQGGLNSPAGIVGQGGGNAPVGIVGQGGGNAPVGIVGQGGGNAPVGIVGQGGGNAPVGIVGQGGGNSPVGIVAQGGLN